MRKANLLTQAFQQAGQGVGAVLGQAGSICFRGCTTAASLHSSGDAAAFVAALAPQRAASADQQ